MRNFLLVLIVVLFMGLPLNIYPSADTAGPAGLEKNIFSPKQNENIAPGILVSDSAPGNAAAGSDSEYKGRSCKSDGFEDVMLSWDVPDIPNLVGYNVYRRIKRYAHDEDVTIIIDGDNNDWANMTKATSYPYPPEDKLHIRDLWVANDDKNLYISVLFSSSISDAAMTEIFLDVDQKISTGSGSKNWRGLTIGAELRYYYNHPNTIYRKEWDKSWKGPFPYEEFISGNYADPAKAWKNTYDITWTGSAHLGSVPLESAADSLQLFSPMKTAKVWENNFVELKIPFSDLENLTGYTINPKHFGIDVIVSTNFDQFPTIGYGPKSPMRFSYGYTKIHKNPITQNSISDTPLDGLTYEYTVFAVDDQGNEFSIAENPITVAVAKVQVDNFNVSIHDSTSLLLEYDFPHNTDVEEIAILRRESRYPEGLADGILVSQIHRQPGEHVEIFDDSLKSGQSYFYSVFSLSRTGKVSKEFWDSKDRSITAAVHGPIKGLEATADYMAYFSSWDEKRVSLAKEYDVVILHPGGGSQLITHEQVAEIQRGIDGIRGTEDDILVIGYVSIGEDFGINPMILKSNTEIGKFPTLNDYPSGSWNLKNYYYPRKLKESTTGPVSYSYEDETYTLLQSTDPLYQFPSFYVDMIDYSGQGGSGKDGLPDQNIEWGGLFVDPGNPEWQSLIREAKIETDYVAGIDWVLGDKDGALGCDGIFLDTVGISATWSQWFPFSYYGDYFWATNGFLDFFAKIGLWYPDKIIMPNRPMHFMFPNLIGKRHDDFRALVNAVFWESYSADVQFWWGGNYSNLFEQAVSSSQDNTDGRGFTTFVMDYWNVMIDAEEGGEFQKAPWYETIEGQVERAQEHDFLTYVSNSRSLAELSDFVYYYRNPEERTLPDLYVHSILTEKNDDGTIHVSVKITNQGSDVPREQPFMVETKLNDTLLERTSIRGLKHLEIKSIELDLALTSIGNNLEVEVDSLQQVDELDEQPQTVERNNTKSRYIDRYLVPQEGWFPYGFAPDIMIKGVEFSSAIAVVGEPLTIKIAYYNASDEGVATDSRLYYWLAEGEGRKVLGNIKTPFLMPGETKIIEVTYTPVSSGKISMGIVADGTYKCIESNETNNYYDTSVYVISSRQSSIDLSDSSCLGPFTDGTADGTNNDVSADIKEVLIVSDDAYTFFRMDLAGTAAFDKFAYMVFIDTNKDNDTGYEVSTIAADYLMINGSLLRYTGSGADDWSWESFDMSKDLVFNLVDDEHAIEYGVPHAVLYNKDKPLGVIREDDQIDIICYVSDEDDATVDEIYPSYSSKISFPPLGKNILIDGDMTDWDRTDTIYFVGRDTLYDGYNKRLIQVKDAIGGYADLEKVMVTYDDAYFYINLQMRNPIEVNLLNYYIFFDIDMYAKTGYRTHSDQIGAEYCILNGTLYRYIGDGITWQWDPLPQEVYSSLGNIHYANSIELALPYDQLPFEENEVELYVMTSDAKGVGWENDIDDFFPDENKGHFVIPLSGTDAVEWTHDVVDYREGNDKTLDQENISSKESETPRTEVPVPVDQDAEGESLDTLHTVVAVQTMDGLFDDWEKDPEVVFLGKDPANDNLKSESSIDIIGVWYVFHDNTLFLKVEAKEAIQKLDSNLLIFIDSDNNILTGYKNIIGSDVLIQGDGNAYILETGTKWEPDHLGLIYVNQGVQQKNLIEFAIPEGIVGNFSQKFQIMLRSGASGSSFSDKRKYDAYNQVVLNKDNLPVSSGSLPPMVIFAMVLLITIGVAIVFVLRLHKHDGKH